MAQDCLGVLDALSIERAHVLGVSMGGMISQRVAFTAPRRLLSLTSVMSSSGAKNLPAGNPELAQKLMTSGSTDPEKLMAHTLSIYKMLGSPAYPTDESLLRQHILAAFQRNYDPVGVMRQLAAVVCDTDRAESLGKITAPTLVVHGTDDPLIPMACGEDTQRRIPGAQMLVVNGMGHDLPAGIMPQLMPRLLAHLQGNSPITGVAA